MNEAIESVHRFIDDIVVPRRSPLPGVPAAFRVDPSDQSEWSEWAVYDSPVTESDLDELETEFDVCLPFVLRSYFTHKHLLDGDFGLVRMPEMPANDPLRGLRQQIAIMADCPIFQRLNLVPFAQDGNDGGPICILCDRPDRIVDGPVFFTDHGLLHDPTYRGVLLWDSLIHMFDAVTVERLSYDSPDTG